MLHVLAIRGKVLVGRCQRYLRGLAVKKRSEFRFAGVQFKRYKLPLCRRIEALFDELRHSGISSSQVELVPLIGLASSQADRTQTREMLVFTSARMYFGPLIQPSSLRSFTGYQGQGVNCTWLYWKYFVPRTGTVLGTFTNQLFSNSIQYEDYQRYEFLSEIRLFFFSSRINKTKIWKFLILFLSY